MACSRPVAADLRALHEERSGAIAVAAPRVVDVHHHWVPADHVRFVERYLREGESASRDGATLSIARGGVTVSTIDATRAGDVEAHRLDMRQAGVDVAVFSLGLWCEWLTLPLAREVNDELADVQAASDGAIVGLAHVPPLDEGAERELHRAVRDRGLRGVGITTHWRGVYLDDPAFRGFFRAVADLDVPVVVHASTTPPASSMLHDHGLGPILGRVVDQLAAVVRLIASGLLEELPTLRIVLPHLGGGYFALKARFGAGPGRSALARRSGAALERMWFDTAPAGWGPAELSLAVTNLGAEKILFGSDYPVRSDWLRRAADAVRAAPLDADQRARIMGGNATDLFRIEVSTR